MVFVLAILALESRSVHVSQSAAPESAADAAALKQFDAAVRQYMLLRRSAVTELPPLVVTADPAEIASRSDALANAIRRARGQVATGGFFSPPVAALLRRRIEALARTSDLADVFTPALDDRPTVTVVQLHARFPLDSPMATMPPSLLNVLPPLPPELEYRFIGTMLVVRDVHAALILDVAADMAPSKR